METLKEIEDNHRKRVYGTCNCCKQDFKYGDDGYEIRLFRCASSQGQPDTFYIDKTTKVCIECLKKNIDKDITATIGYRG